MCLKERIIDRRREKSSPSAIGAHRREGSTGVVLSWMDEKEVTKGIESVGKKGKDETKSLVVKKNVLSKANQGK